MPRTHASDAANPFERAPPGRHAAGMRFFLSVWKALLAARTRAELHALSDRTLRDIGLERGQIDALFR